MDYRLPALVLLTYLVFCDPSCGYHNGTNYRGENTPGIKNIIFTIEET